MSSGTRLFVGNLPENTHESELRSAFSSYGEITSVDLKNKSGSTEEQKKFAFVTISSANLDIEACIKRFSNEDFNGARLYVTRARESFLERLQRERQETQRKEEEKEKQHEELPKKNPVIKLSDKLNPRKRKSDLNNSETNHISKSVHKSKHVKPDFQTSFSTGNKALPEGNEKKIDSDKKRLESMKKKRQEFKEKQKIIKIGLTSVDKTPNKKVIFSDSDNEANNTLEINGHNQKPQKKKTLFDDNEDSCDEVNFEIKEQFEGKKGQKVLDLQSRYKSDKRFVLDERFIDGDQSETEKQKDQNDDEIELEQTDEKTKQLNILQDVLGVAIKTKTSEQNNKQSKVKLGMLRFDPLQPEHTKFLMHVEEKKEESKKRKKKNKDKKDEVEQEQIQAMMPEKVEVSKEQFYKVSDTLKEAIAQPTSFSLRSLFTKTVGEDNANQDQEMEYIPLEKPSKPKVKNPLDPGEKNPFVYDSSDSEAEEEVENTKPTTSSQPEVKAVWKENLFFSKDDIRLKEALVFFSKPIETEVHKERRELKSLMKKRIYNKERKNQMFQKKIGGRKKSMKKSYNKIKTKNS